MSSETGGAVQGSPDALVAAGLTWWILLLIILAILIMYLRLHSTFS